MTMDENNIKDNGTISIYEVLMILKKRVRGIGIVAVLIFAFFSAYAVFAPKEYRVSGYVIMNSALEQLEEKPVKKENVFSNVKLPLEMLQRLPKKQQAEKLGIDINSMNDITNVIISIKNDKALKIEILTLSVPSGEKVMAAYYSYINNLRLVQQEWRMKKQLITQNIEDLKVILNTPDELFKSTEGIVLSEIYSSLYEMRETYNTLANILVELEKGLFLIGDIFTADLPVKPRVLLLLATGLLVGGGGGLFWAFFLEWLSIARLRYESE